MKRKDKLHVLGQIENLWYNEITLDNRAGVSEFLMWCDDNLHNEAQKKLAELIAPHVDFISQQLTDY